MCVVLGTERSGRDDQVSVTHVAFEQKLFLLPFVNHLHDMQVAVVPARRDSRYSHVTGVTIGALAIHDVRR